MRGERESEKGLKRGSENEIVKVARERAQGITEYERRRVKEGTRKGRERWKRDGARGPRFGELLNSRGPGLEAGFVVEPSRAEPSRCMYMR